MVAESEESTGLHRTAGAAGVLCEQDEYTGVPAAGDRRKWLITVVTGLLLIAPTGVLADHPDEPTGVVDDVTGSCSAGEMVADPESGSQDTSVEVLVIGDRVDQASVVQVVERAASAYLGADVVLMPTYVSRDFKTTDARRILDQARAAFRGTAEDFDAIVVSTGIDLANPLGPESLAGYAWCVGGISRKRDLYSVAVAELGYGKRSRPDADPSVQLDRDAFLFAHELGHLLGAKHEHGNCVEGLSGEDLQPGEGFVRPCTIMGDMKGRSDLVFGALERAMIRGHARHYGGRPGEDRHGSAAADSVEAEL